MSRYVEQKVAEDGGLALRQYDSQQIDFFRWARSFKRLQFHNKFLAQIVMGPANQNSVVFHTRSPERGVALGSVSSVNQPNSSAKATHGNRLEYC